MGSWSSAERLTAAQKYERQSAAMGRGVTAALVELAAPASGMRILDLAAGTGAPALPLARRVGPQGRIFATDVNAEPLALARQRAAERGLQNLRYAVADAQALPFGNAQFDRVTSRFGVMFFPHPVRALAEARRVLRPGGHVALVAWSRFEQPYFAAIAGTVFHHVGGPLLPAGVHDPFCFAAPGSLADVLRRAGFEEVSEQVKTVAWTWPGPAEEVWEYFRAATAPFRPLLERTPRECAAAIEAEVLSAIRRYQRGPQIEFGAEIVLAAARKT